MKQSISARAVFFRDNDGDDEVGGDGDGFTVFVCFFCVFFFFFLIFFLPYSFFSLLLLAFWFLSDLIYLGVDSPQPC